MQPPRDRNDTGASNHDVCVIVPCYNEEPVVGQVVSELKQAFPLVVVVDDQSHDASGRRAAEAGAIVLRHPVNLGAGGALQTGVTFALQSTQARFFALFDADGQHQATDLQDMVSTMRSPQAPDILIGSRFLGAESLGMPLSRRLLLKLAREFEWVNSGIRLTDAHQGLRVFNRAFAQQLDLRSPDMSWASEFLVQARRTRSTVSESPVTVHYTDYSRGKGQHSINSINLGIDILVDRVLRGRS